MTPAEARTLAQVQAELARFIRYDDESIVHEAWIRQRYDLGAAASYAPARTMAVRTAWHEAGHAVACRRWPSGRGSVRPSIRHGSASAGRVHGVQGGGEQAFVIDAAGQIAERLRDWSMLAGDGELARGSDLARRRWTHGGSGAGSPRVSVPTRWPPGGIASRR